MAYVTTAAPNTTSRFAITPHNVAMFLLDAYPLIVCIYVYGEDGKTIKVCTSISFAKKQVRDWFEI